ncbi:MAG: hypothetical protein ACK5KL_19865 [Dysgonomonas sp.]|jgi:hypothetical protein
MKNKYYFLLLFILTSTTVFAQQIETKFIFDEFKQGKLVNKRGDTYQALFNYDIINQRLMFISAADSTILEIAEPNEVSYINIDGRIFEHIKGTSFYERMNIGDCVFYIQWKAKYMSKGKKGAYGTTSHTSAVGSIGMIENQGGQFLKLTTAEDFEVKSENLYYLKMKNNLKRFYSADSLAKLFKGHEEDIKEYVKKNNLDFNNLENIKAVVEYCSQYLK